MHMITASVHNNEYTRPTHSPPFGTDTQICRKPRSCFIRVASSLLLCRVTTGALLSTVLDMIIEHNKPYLFRTARRAFLPEQLSFFARQFLLEIFGFSARSRRVRRAAAPRVPLRRPWERRRDSASGGVLGSGAIPFGARGRTCCRSRRGGGRRATGAGAATVRCLSCIWLSGGRRGAAEGERGVIATEINWIAYAGN